MKLVLKKDVEFWQDWLKCCCVHLRHTKQARGKMHTPLGVAFCELPLLCWPCAFAVLSSCPQTPFLFWDSSVFSFPHLVTIRVESSFYHNWDVKQESEWLKTTRQYALELCFKRQHWTKMVRKHVQHHSNRQVKIQWRCWNGHTIISVIIDCKHDTHWMKSAFFVYVWHCWKVLFAFILVSSLSSVEHAFQHWTFVFFDNQG